MFSVLIGVLGLETPMNANIDSARAERKALASNRHGIMHGAKKHLDYGTEINSFKVFSLLGFVSLVLAEPGLKPNEQVDQADSKDADP